jgi:hypothetical protein
MGPREPAARAALAAASSPDWSLRARAGVDLVAWADDPHVADVLLHLVLDPDDTVVTDRTCAALLRRNDEPAIRVLARGWATADDPEQHDHILWSLVGDLLGPGDPCDVERFVDICRRLTGDPDPVTRSGATDLLRHATPSGSG